MATVAFLLASGFEESEFRIPFEGLRQAGHAVVILGTRAHALVRGKHGKDQATIDDAAADRRPEEFDALVIPGGKSPARLRTDPRVVAFVGHFAATGRPLAAICHGPELLAAAGVVAGRTLTSWPAIRHELEAHGARWLDAPVVTDRGFITSRKPLDVAAFTAAIRQALG